MESITQLHNISPEELKKELTNAFKDVLIEYILNSKPTQKEEVLLTREDTAKLLKISLPCLHNWMNKGILEAYKIGNRTYFYESDIHRILKDSNKKDFRN